nr:Testis-expressed sequence 264 protein [Haemonchus contortus]
MFELAFIAVCLLILAYVAFKFAVSGFFSNIQPSVTESPKYLGKSLTVYYKHHIGAYSGVSTIFKEVRELLPSGATTFGIYYDNPRERDEHLLQSAVGVIFGEDGKDLYTNNYSQQLTRWGYEKMVLPKVDRAVEATQPFTGYLSMFALIYRTYGIIWQYIVDNRLETTIALEFYDNDGVCVSFPLDHTEEFVVPEHLSIEALESRLAKKKFDSDEESSESEGDQPSEVEIPDEGIVEIKGEGAGGDKKDN